MHKVIIEYCDVWNYYSRAVSLAEAIKQTFGLEVGFRKGKGGNFEVFYDDECIYSKAETYRFPKIEEVLALLKERI